MSAAALSPSSRSQVDAATSRLSTPLPMVALPCESRSTSSTRRGAAARAAARFTAVVVLPTPPFWLAMAMMRAMRMGLMGWKVGTGHYAGWGPDRGNPGPRTDDGAPGTLRPGPPGRAMGRSGFQHCQTTNGVFVLVETAMSCRTWVARESPLAPRQGPPVLTSRTNGATPMRTRHGPAHQACRGIQQRLRPAGRQVNPIASTV